MSHYLSVWLILYFWNSDETKWLEAPMVQEKIAAVEQSVA